MSSDASISSIDHQRWPTSERCSSVVEAARVDLVRVHPRQEEDLGLAIAQAVELELGDALPDRSLEGDAVKAGLLAELAQSSRLGVLADLETAAGRDPPRAVLGACRVAALEQQEAVTAVQQEDAGRLSFQQVRHVARAYGGTAGIGQGLALGTSWNVSGTVIRAQWLSG